MEDAEDASDLFNPWRPSDWLDRPGDGIGIGIGVGIGVAKQATPNPLFTLHVPDTAASLETHHGLIGTGEIRALSGIRDDSHAFFKLPSLLRELADQEREAKPQTKPAAEKAQVDPEPKASSSLDGDDEELWLSQSNDAERPCEHGTWESFEQGHQGPRSPTFITEAGPAAFDALLVASQDTHDARPDVLDAAVYCAFLRSLALGRSSRLFSWDPGKNSFVKTAPHLRVSGLSLDLIQAIDSQCLCCGNSARLLQTFADATTYSAAASPTRVALAGIVDRLVTAVRSELSDHSRDVRSILQLQSVVQPACSVLSYFRELVKKLSEQTSDEGILSCLFQEAQASEYRDELLRDLTREVLRMLSKPWTDFVEEWLGLKAEEGIAMNKDGPGKGFIRVADKMWIDDRGFELEEADYFLDEDKVPAFVTDDMAQTIFETGRNLRFLREYHPEHPLTKPDVVCRMTPPKLAWEFDWDAISKLEASANRYRDAVSRAIQGMLPEAEPETNLSSPINGLKPGPVELRYFGKDDAEVEANIIASMQQLDQPLEDLIEAQASLVNQECMKLLFSSHHLRIHIDLLRQYFLLGNGLLCSRLSHALFDPSLHTAERRAGVALGGGVMGLRLGGRQTWPPTSSELRLALMGVLSECYEPPLRPDQTTPSHGAAKSDLPGDLSFAVRDLSPEEIDRCMDPDSLEALDFLRLSYTPPAPLRPALPPTLLLRYDRVFRLLLRVLRMLYVANELLVTTTTAAAAAAATGGSGSGSESTASAARFRFEARHFIRQVAAYFFDVGIGAPWRRFERWLDAVEAECVNPSSGSAYRASRTGPTSTTTATTTAAAPVPTPPAPPAPTTTTAKRACPTPAALHARHEQTLDEIMAALLLRRRQAPVLRLLEETFAVVLRFARLSARRGVESTSASASAGCEGAGGGGGEAGEQRRETEEELYALFRKKVEVFLTVCRGLGEKMGAGAGGGRTAGSGGGGAVANPVEQLVVMVDMSGFYSGKRGGV
ncbi:67d62c16-11ce-4cc3-abca-4e67e4149e00 [Thermothielavioides terrestris]|uniref:Spindle pole body component n=1 Tax=Thermothielavioides terrestris TaxID=2587410 RepID=A0A446BMG4_9PEZI|nr:67d62c16-11ce-4cc3-abca-4e67e4149e00 [Thermothielavioides terrestris]